MRVLVDTTVWSLVLRRRPGGLNDSERRIRDELAGLVGDDRVAMIGPVRQEILSGVRDEGTFSRLRQRLRAFDDEALDSGDYEAAALAHNECRRRGVAGSAVDFLICAVARRRGMAIFTLDGDFERYAAILAIRLHAIPGV